jgi:hypothetical protein
MSNSSLTRGEFTRRQTSTAVLRWNQVEALAAQARCFAAYVFERHVGVENTSRDHCFKRPLLGTVCAEATAVAAARPVTKSLRRMGGLYRIGEVNFTRWRKSGVFVFGGVFFCFGRG